MRRSSLHGRAQGAALAALAPGAVFAHADHGAASAPMSFFEGLVHLLTQPDHVALLVLAAIVGAVAARAWHARRASRRTPSSSPHHDRRSAAPR
jgi:hydrogenase/urease accessory protein HupE